MITVDSMRWDAIGKCWVSDDEKAFLLTLPKCWRMIDDREYKPGVRLYTIVRDDGNSAESRLVYVRQ